MDLKLTDKQFDFFTNQKRFGLFRGGVGSGKTFIGCNWVLKQIGEQPRAKGFIGANTYRQLQNSTLSALFEVLDDYGLPYKYNKNDGILKIMDTEVITMSLDNYNMARGIQIGWFWLDEVRDAKEEAFLVLMGRLRDKRADNYFGRLTSTPAGFDWQYDYFDGEKRTDDFFKVEATSMDNPFLPDGYVDSLKNSYDEKIYEQEVLGKVINITQGRVYYAFNREKHVKPTQFNPAHHIYIGMDFNVNPMTAAVLQYYDFRFKVLDEFYLMSSDTIEIAREIKKRYPRAKIIPDSTGKRVVSSSAGNSDFELLRREGLHVVNTQNPFRLDRYNALNNVMEKCRMEIDPKCVKLIRDLEMVSFKEGSNKPDATRDSTLTHISDALGYAVWFLEPIERPKFDIGMMPR